MWHGKTTWIDFFRDPIPRDVEFWNIEKNNTLFHLAKSKASKICKLVTKKYRLCVWCLMCLDEDNLIYYQNKSALIRTQRNYHCDWTKKISGLYKMYCCQYHKALVSRLIIFWNYLLFKSKPLQSYSSKLVVLLVQSITFCKGKKLELNRPALFPKKKRFNPYSFCRMQWSGRRSTKLIRAQNENNGSRLYFQTKLNCFLQ